MHKWQALLNDERRKPKASRASACREVVEDSRTEFERDFDRILFCTPVRRMADKTQVFPLDPNDSVRTRLTHSHEVANLCRSLGTTLAYGVLAPIQTRMPARNIPALLAAVGLAHDLGNPPFGHSGERAIQDWIAAHPALTAELAPAHKRDFELFEGNAQTIRLVTRLQLINDDYGLNLTYGTLAALLKYPIASDRIDRSRAATKKHGFFQSEAAIVEEVWGRTGLGPGVRHPFAFVMEACDDIAYAVLDAEDAVKKGLASFADLMDFLRQEISPGDICRCVINDAESDHSEYRQRKLSPAELNDIAMQKFRVYAIALMIDRVRKAFETNLEGMLDGSFVKDLLTASDAEPLCAALKNFDREHAYRHPTVLELESLGFNVIHELMDLLWEAIENNRARFSGAARRAVPFAAYAYQRISENYRRVFENETNPLPLRYRELQLLTDMIAGMTDSFALDLRDDLKQYHRA